MFAGGTQQSLDFCLHFARARPRECREAAPGARILVPGAQLMTPVASALSRTPFLKKIVERDVSWNLKESRLRHEARQLE